MASETAALVGVRLREAREEQGWTRRRLVSEMDGIAVENDVYRWETGKHRPRDDALAAAARALGKPLSYFLELDRPTPDLSTNGDRLDEIEKKLDRILSLLQADDTAAEIRRVYAKMADRLEPADARHPARSRRKADRRPEAPPAAA